VRPHPLQHTLLEALLLTTQVSSQRVLGVLQAGQALEDVGEGALEVGVRLVGIVEVVQEARFEQGDRADKAEGDVRP
jgi:hypothetical protein